MYYDLLNAKQLKENDQIELNGANYTLLKKILRQSDLYTPEQEQTKEAFAFKWNQESTYNSEIVKNKAKKWLYERYLGGNVNLLELIFPSGAKVLDAGCGAAVSAQLLFGKRINNLYYLGVDISEAVDVAFKTFQERGFKGEFIQADILNLPFKAPLFDAIFSEGVLHHTNSTEDAIKKISQLLLPGGYFLFYVYKTKGPVREFTDDYIRKQIEMLSDQEAWASLMPLTRLGKALGDLCATVDVPEDIELLGIPAGKIDIQRLFYWYIFKAYYDEKYTLDEMNHINFDWYRPLNCHRQTPEQVEAWCGEANLTIERLDIQEAGITVVARKNKGEPRQECVE